MTALVLATLLVEPDLSGKALDLFHQAEKGKFYSVAAALKPDIRQSTDGKTFVSIWKSVDEPKKWIVSMPGRRGFATDDLAIWHPHLKGREVGIVSLQWWLGSGDMRTDYYSPEECYREISAALKVEGVTPGSVMFHGFSRGSANSFAVVALDAGKGSKYFSLAVASSGAVALDFPPTQSIMNGDYGKDPLKGTRWITAAGAKDQPRDGIEAMQRTAKWLKDQGATVLYSIEDMDLGHGALVLNPKNAKRALDSFFEI